MKIFRILLVLVTLGLIITSCQKDFSFEAGNAKGNIVKDASGDCTGFNLQGPYQAGAVLTNASFVDIQIDITKVGIYLIKTDTINGYSFSANGSTGVLGVNTIRLVASGKPIALSTDVFTVKFDGGSCQFDVTVTPFVVTPAVFTFTGAGGPCTGAVQSGTYTSGIAMNPTTNFITIPVSVTTIGTYNITSTTVNGVTFSSGPGTFAAVGTTNVILRATGTPANSPTPVTSTGYDIVATNTCSFSIIYAPTPGPSTFTLNCAAATFSTTFQVGTAIPAGTTVTIPITGPTAGSFNVPLSTLNGISLSGNGILTTASTSITLTVSGTPAIGANPSTSIPITTGGGSCNVILPVTAGGGGTPSTDSISCSINGGAIKVFDDGPGIVTDNTQFPYFGIQMGGDADPLGNEGIGFGIYNLTGTFTAGTSYTVNQGPATLVGGDYQSSPGINFIAASTFPTPTNPFTITITSIAGGAIGTPGTRVKGTFGGILKDNTGAGPGSRTVTQGYFDLTF